MGVADMKIALFHEVNPGGARRGANEFSRTLMRHGHRVDLFVVDSHSHPEEKPFFSQRFVYRFVPVAWSGHDWKARLYRDTIELVNLRHLHQRIARDIDARGYDVAFVHPSTYTQAPFLLHFLKTPTLYYCQEPLRLVYDPVCAIPSDLDPIRTTYEKLIRVIRKDIDAQNIKSADRVLANSRFTQEQILSAYGLDSTVCHMGVDTRIFYPDGKKAVDLLFIGTRDTAEGYGLFQESLAHMKKPPSVRYLIRGENWTSNDGELRREYSRARIVICFGYNEPFGLIPLEAMACGAVVVALNEGGYRDSVKDGKTGVLVERDPKKIAKIIQTLLRKKVQVQHLCSAAKADIKLHWSWKKSTISLLNKLENL